MKEKHLAAIDLGTNTFRLLIATVRYHSGKNTYSLKEIHSERIITRLGEGLSRNRLLKKDTMAKSLSVLRKFRDILSLYDIHKVSAVATSALRDARNSNEFLTKARESAGLKIKIISGAEEARLTASGMLMDIIMPGTALMIDIGGGSTELIFVKDGKPLHVKSLDLGVVSLATKYMKKDPPSDNDITRMKAEIDSTLSQVSGYFKKLLKKGSLLIGTAGTITALAAMKQKLKKFDHAKVHKSRITREELERTYSDIALITSRERAKFIPFEPSRLDIIVPGTLILLKLMDTFGFQEIIVSNYGLREGILVRLYNKFNNAAERE